MSYTETLPDLDMFTQEEIGVAADLLDSVAAMSADSSGVSRPAWSRKESEVLDHLTARAEAEGLAVWSDAVDNRVFSLPEDQGKPDYTLIGSHVDSVPVGGNFDGLAGVIAGLICLIHQRRKGTGFSRPVRVIAMRGEESAWFGPCYTASRALTGGLGADALAAKHKSDGRTLADHMADVGVDLGPVRAGTPLMDLTEIREYLELHIEQGPLLLGDDRAAAVVTGIRGNIRLKDIVARGEAGHSGAVPREYRRDPVMAIAQLLSAMDALWADEVSEGTDLVMTTGMIGTDPTHHAMARIPESVSFSFEVRSQSPETLSRVEETFRDKVRAISDRTGVAFDLPDPIRNAPAALDEDVQLGLLDAMERAGQQRYAMPSGGGHDAAVFANAGVRAGMVFVRSRGGSHNPAESMAPADMMAGASIFLAHITADD